MKSDLEILKEQYIIFRKLKYKKKVNIKHLKAFKELLNYE